MQRISREQMFLEICDTISKRSTCFRQNVGALVVYNHRIVSIGYNGSAPGEAHCEGPRCPLSASGGCTRSIHAEINALTYAPQKLTPLELYVSLSPCMACAQKIAEDGRVKTIYFRQEYRDRSSLEYFITKGIEVYRLTSAGYKMNAYTGDLVQ